MRVAVCLAGQPRSYKVCCKNIRNVFENAEVSVDYHIHTWACNEGNATPRQELNRELLETDLLQMYSPKFLKVENYWTDIVYPETWTVSQTLKSVVNIEDSEEFRYDWVFVGRLDWFRPYGKANYSLVAQKSKELREMWGGYEGIDAMECEGKSYVRQEDFTYSFNSPTARVWSNLYEDRLELTQKVRNLKGSFEHSDLESRICNCQECFFALEAVLHNIAIYPGADILEPGFPLRVSLADKVGMSIYRPDVRQKVLNFLASFGWYHTEQEVNSYFGSAVKPGMVV